MADVFISYAREDRTAAANIADSLNTQGWSVWWDRKIAPGLGFEALIEEELAASKCVIVLWSGNSIGSNWVRNEAGEALERGVLIPVLLERIKVPIAFRHVHAADLVGWNGDTQNAEWQEILGRVAVLSAAVSLTSEIAVPGPSAESASHQAKEADSLDDAPAASSAEESLEITESPAYQPLEPLLETGSTADVGPSAKSQRRRRKASGLGKRSRTASPLVAGETGVAVTDDLPDEKFRDLLPPPSVAARIGFVSMLRQSGEGGEQEADNSPGAVADDANRGGFTSFGLAAVLVGIWIISLTSGYTLGGLIHFALVVAAALMVRWAVRRST